MAFNFDTLALNVEAPPRQWTYTTSDTRATVTSAGYFSRAQFNGMKQGDRIRVTNGADVYTVEITAIESSGAASATLADVVSVRTDLDEVIDDVSALNSLVGSFSGAPAASTANLIYPALDELLASAADIVDVFVYDTRLDSDGGAWTQRCQHTSWYNETLGSGTRGVRREFPKVAGIVLRSGTTNTLAIYDFTDFDNDGVPRMWRIQARSSSGIIDGTPTSVRYRNGRVFVTTSTGLYVFDFANDKAERHDASGKTTWTGGIAQAGSYAGNVASGAIVSATANHADARVLPHAPLDAAGLPIPTVVTSTAAGLSFIFPSGLVYDVTRTGGYAEAKFADDTNVFAVTAAGAAEYGPVPYADVANNSWRTREFTSSAAPAVRGSVSCVA